MRLGHMCTLSCIHVCTPSYTSGNMYMYLPPRINVYSVIYGKVHMCTLSYMTWYTCILCRYDRVLIYIYTVVYAWLHVVPIQITFGEVDPF